MPDAPLAVSIAFQTNKTSVATLLLCRDISGMFYPFLPVTEFVASNAVALPVYSDMTWREVEIITGAVRDLQANSAAVRERLTAQSAPA